MYPLDFNEAKQYDIVEQIHYICLLNKNLLELDGIDTSDFEKEYSENFKNIANFLIKIIKNEKNIQISSDINKLFHKNILQNINKSFPEFVASAQKCIAEKSQLFDDNKKPSQRKIDEDGDILINGLKIYKNAINDYYETRTFVSDKDRAKMIYDSKQLDCGFAVFYTKMKDVLLEKKTQLSSVRGKYLSRLLDYNVGLYTLAKSVKIENEKV